MNKSESNESVSASIEDYVEEEYMSDSNEYSEDDEGTAINETKSKIQFNHKILSGIEFNKFFSDESFVLLTNSSETHYGYQFKDGLNISTKTTRKCISNELRSDIIFVKENDIINFMVKDVNYNAIGILYHTRHITIPNDANVFIRRHNTIFVTDKAILSPREKINDDIYINVVRQNKYRLEYIPDSVKTRDLCLYVVNATANNLQCDECDECDDLFKFVPKSLKDYEMCTHAVTNNWYALKFVPRKLKVTNKDICMRALKQNGHALKYVPAVMIDKNMCIEAIKNPGPDNNSGDILKYIPKDLLTKKIYLAAIEIDSTALKCIKPTKMNKDLCLNAVKKNGLALIYVPTHLIDREICLEAIKSDWHATKNVPRNMMTKEMCMDIVKINGWILQYITRLDKNIDKEICTEAVKQKGYSLKFVPKSMMDKNICMEAIKQSGRAIIYVPNTIMSKGVAALFAINHNINTFDGTDKFISNNLKNEIEKSYKILLLMISIKNIELLDYYF